MKEGLVIFIVAGLTLTVMMETGCGGGEVPEFNQQKAFQFLTDQCDIGPRYPGTRGHREVQRYIAGKLKRFKANVSLQEFEGVNGRRDTLQLLNIIANFNPKAEKRILLGAHYDTRPWADKDPDPENHDRPIVGANDGASGVAVLLELARHMEELPPGLGVDLVFFDGEDSGRYRDLSGWILGSRHFVKRAVGYRPRAVIIVDMVGEKGLEVRKEGFSMAATSWLLDELFSIAEQLGFNEFENEQGSTVYDDHLPFINEGLPAVVLIDFEYAYWHTLEDTPDKCSPRSLNAVGTVLLNYLWKQ